MFEDANDPIHGKQSLAVARRKRRKVIHKVTADPSLRFSWQEKPPSENSRNGADRENQRAVPSDHASIRHRAAEILRLVR